MKPLARLLQHRATHLTGVAVVLLGSAVALGAAAPASASAVSVTYKFKVTADGFSGTDSATVDVTTSAPATVAPGGALTVTATTGAFELESSFDGVTIVNVENVSVLVKVPANSSYVSCTLSGGSGLGSGTPTCTEKGGTVTISVPGPIPGGTTVTPPTVNLNLKAGKKGKITTKLSGTSYTKPGLTGTANLEIFGAPVTATAVGYPHPSPALTTTKIT
jgi:dehydratase